MSKLDFKLHNFENAVARLREAAAELQRNPAADVVRDGLIQRFAFKVRLSDIFFGIVTPVRAKL